MHLSKPLRPFCVSTALRWLTIRELYTAPVNKVRIVTNDQQANGTFASELSRMARDGNVKESLSLFRSLDPSIINGRIANLVFQAIINSKMIINKGDQAEHFWNEIKRMVPPNIIIYNCIMNAHSKTKDDLDRGRKAEKWLRRAYEDGFQPDTYSYTCVINCYARTNLMEAQRVFDEYRQTFASKLEVGPFNALMWGLSIKSRVQTEMLMHQMLENKMVPSIHAFMAVMKSQTLDMDIQAGERARYWCLKYSQITKQRPDPLMWTMALHACAKSGHPDAGHQADLVVKDLHDAGLHGEIALYNVWMDCWTKSRRPNAVHRVQEILEGLERGAFSSKTHPDVLSYSAAIQAWSKSGLPEAPQKAEELLKRMQKPRGGLGPLAPTLICYEALMDAYARCAGGSARALQILDFVEKMAMQGRFKLRVRTYAAALLALSQDGGTEATRHAEAVMNRMPAFGVYPNEYCFSLLITLYANDISDSEGHRKALYALDRMKKLGPPPNVYTYTAIISAFGNHGDATTAKELWLETLKSIHDTSVLTPPLNATLNAFRRKGSVEAAEEAESLLRTSIQSIRPDALTFGIVMGAWSWLGQVDRTIALLDLAKRDHPYCYNPSLDELVAKAHAKPHLNKKSRGNVAQQSSNSNQVAQYNFDLDEIAIDFSTNTFR